MDDDGSLADLELILASVLLSDEGKGKIERGESCSFHAVFVRSPMISTHMQCDASR